MKDLDLDLQSHLANYLRPTLLSQDEYLFKVLVLAAENQSSLFKALYSGTIKALWRLYEGSIRLYEGVIEALSRSY
jgi:hypothetical protein